MFFELNYKYNSYIFYKKDIDIFSRSEVVYKLTEKLGNLIAV